MSMLKLGASKPWTEVMEVMTGSPKMDTRAFREYFQPLEDWLKQQNRKNGVKVGWKVKDYGKYCKPGSGAITLKASLSAMIFVFVTKFL